MLENKKLTLEYKMEAADYKALCNFSMFFRKKYMMPFLIFVAVAAIAVIGGSAIGVLDLPTWYVVFYVVLICVFALVLLAQRRVINKVLKTDKVSFSGLRTCIADDKHFKTQGSGGYKGNAEFKWEVFYQGYEVKKYFYLFISSQQAYVVPKASMTLEEVAFLGELLSRKLGKAFFKRCR